MVDSTFNNINSIDYLLNQEPFGLDVLDKDKLFKEAIFKSFKHHIKNNELFRNYCNNQGFNLNSDQIRLIDYPYLPVNIFKKFS